LSYDAFGAASLPEFVKFRHISVTVAV